MDYAVYKVKSDSLVLALIMEAKYTEEGTVVRVLDNAVAQVCAFAQLGLSEKFISTGDWLLCNL